MSLNLVKQAIHPAHEPRSSGRQSAPSYLSKAMSEPTHVGCYTDGHGAIAQACKVGDEVLVGVGAVILDGAVIGKQSIIGAKALVKQGMKIPPGSLVLGATAKAVRQLTKRERSGLKWWAGKYVDNGAYCLKHGINVGGSMPT